MARTKSSLADFSAHLGFDAKPPSAIIAVGYKVNEFRLLDGETELGSVTKRYEKCGTRKRQKSSGGIGTVPHNEVWDS